MARDLIASEGVPKSNGRVLKPGALYWDQEVIAVVNAEMDQIIGKVTDIRKDSNGEVTGEFSMDTRPYDIVLYLTHIEIEPWQSPLVITNQVIKRGRLRAIVLGPRSPLNPRNYQPKP